MQILFLQTQSFLFFISPKYTLKIKHLKKLSDKSKHARIHPLLTFVARMKFKFAKLLIVKYSHVGPTLTESLINLLKHVNTTFPHPSFLANTEQEKENVNLCTGHTVQNFHTLLHFKKWHFEKLFLNDVWIDPNVPLLKKVPNGFLIHHVVTLITINLFTISSIILEYSLFPFPCYFLLHFYNPPHPACQQNSISKSPTRKRLDLYHLIDSYNFWWLFVILPSKEIISGHNWGRGTSRNIT